MTGRTKGRAVTAPAQRGRGRGPRGYAPRPTVGRAIAWVWDGARACVRHAPGRLGGGLAVLACLLLGACRPLDREAALRQEVGRLVFVEATRDFRSTPRCTAASFTLISDQLRQRGGAVAVASVPAALPRLARGETVGFALPGASPNAVSEALMAQAPQLGAALLAAVVTPARGCMSEGFRADIARVLAQPETLLVFDPGRGAALLVYRPLAVAFYLRARR